MVPVRRPASGLPLIDGPGGSRGHWGRRRVAKGINGRHQETARYGEPDKSASRDRV
jgi:hypothetical protein